MFFSIGRSAAVTIAAAVLLFVSPDLRAQAPAETAGNGTNTSASITVTKVDEVSVMELLKADGKPLLVNFWATWCVPCRQEFPDLVELDREYKGKIDFITISLDDPVEIDRDVPKFLGEMGAEMPAYLLRTLDESAVIGSISDDWQGGLPFTALYDRSGAVIYAKQGLIKPDVMRALLDRLLESGDRIVVTELAKAVDGRRTEAEFYFRNNWMQLRKEAVKRGIIESFEMIVTNEEYSSAGHDFILITRYRDRQQYVDAENLFRGLIRELRPEGPMLMNDLKPDDFRKSISVANGRPAN